MSTTIDNHNENGDTPLEFITDSGRLDGQPMAVLHNPDNNNEWIRAEKRAFIEIRNGDFA